MEKEKWNGDLVQPNIPKKRSTVYITPTIDSDFREICEREDISASRKIEEFMLEYVQKHKAGNPQLSLTSYVKPEGLGPNHVLCHYVKGRRNDGHVFCSNLKTIKNPIIEGGITGEWLNGVACYSCKFNKLRKK
jgi:hypothetical protein